MMSTKQRKALSDSDLSAEIMRCATLVCGTLQSSAHDYTAGELVALAVEAATRIERRTP